MPRHPTRFSATPARLGAPAPSLGEQTDDVLGDLGLVFLLLTLGYFVVALTHGWGNSRTPGMRVAHQTPGVNANALLPTGPGSFEPLSSQAFMTGVPVELHAL